MITWWIDGDFQQGNESNNHTFSRREYEKRGKKRGNLFHKTGNIPNMVGWWRDNRDCQSMFEAHRYT